VDVAVGDAHLGPLLPQHGGHEAHTRADHRAGE
jgi:hypothetical protein